VGINRGPLAVSAGLVIAVCMSVGASADVLRVGGTGGATGMLNYLAMMAASGSGEEIKVIPSLGSSGAIRAVQERVIDIAVSGRKLKPAEAAKGLTVMFEMRTPYVLISSRRATDGLKSADIAAVYSNEKAKWPDRTPVRIILRPRSDSDTAHLGQLFPGMSAAIETARKRSEVPLAATDQDNADMAERIPGSLSGATFTQIAMEHRQLRLIPIDGIEPTLENFEKGIYPYGKTFYVVAAAKPSAAVEKFIAYLRSPAGHQALRHSGNLLAGE
jgi:phosphate transport system substrate-binding protein